MSTTTLLSNSEVRVLFLLCVPVYCFSTTFYEREGEREEREKKRMRTIILWSFKIQK